MNNNSETYLTLSMELHWSWDATLIFSADVCFSSMEFCFGLALRICLGLRLQGNRRYLVRPADRGVKQTLHTSLLSGKNTFITLDM